MVWIGGLIVILTFVAIIKKFEPRTSLFASGLVMCLLSGEFLATFDAFTKTLVANPLVPIIVCAMGFAYVINLTGCDKHFSFFALRYVIRVRPILIPASLAIIWIFGIAINSPAGLAAAVGPIIAPVLIRAGIHPAMAAASLLAGSWGSYASISSLHIALISKLSGTEIPDIVIATLPASLPTLFICCLGLYATALIRKENKGYVYEGDGGTLDEVTEFKINYLKVLMPLLPIIMLILGSKQVALIKQFTVPQAMMICMIITVAVARVSPFAIMSQFCKGMGEGFGAIVSLIAAAAVFTAGMGAIGLTGALVESMKESTHLAKVAGSWGPFLIAALSGSGDAATLAFNNTITPHAADFGLAVDRLGMTAYLGGSLGRSMSPVAGVCIIYAQAANVNPIELSKRVAPTVITANLAGMFILQYLL